jgi:hypothetical protein
MMYHIQMLLKFNNQKWIHLLPRRITLSDLLPFKINYKIMDLIGIWQDSLDGGSARRKTATCTKIKRTEITKSGIRTHE